MKTTFFRRFGTRLTALLLALSLTACFDTEDDGPSRVRPTFATTTSSSSLHYPTTQGTDNYTSRTTSGTPMRTTVPTTTNNRYPGDTATFADHILLAERRDGPCDRLQGDVLLTMILVDDDGGTWTADALSATKKAHQAATSQLKAEAARYGVQLNITLQYITAKTTGTMNRENYESWVDRVLSAAGLPAKWQVTDKLKMQSGADEAPVLLCVNYAGRSFAVQAQDLEYAILMTDSLDYRHELLHLFGAEDFYFPEAVETAAKKQFSSSVMLASSTVSVDPLTAYLVGWTDTLSSPAKNFLKDTSWITQDYWEKEYDKEIYTGYVTNYKKEDGIYTGDLVFGIFHGQGTFTWTDGDVYTGAWANGIKHGQGTYTWTSGNVYTGDWVNDKRTGQGTYTWKDGSVYVGAWVDNNRNGYGVLTYPNGKKQSGQWKNDQFVG